MIEQLGGPPLSFNNLWDLQAARGIAGSFQLPACAIVKHATPCGVAVGATIEEAYERALEADPVAAFGGVIAVNRPVSEQLGARLADQVVHVLFAPGYEQPAVELLRQRPSLRILEDRERRKASPGERDMKRVLGGLLIQDRDTENDDRDTMQVVSQTSPSEQQWGDLLFAWRVCKHVRSNAIVIARDLATVGIGGGDVSRVDAVRIAVEKAGGRNRGRGAGLGRILPVRRWPPHRGRGRRAGDHPARRLQARRRGDRRRRRGRRVDGVHRAAALPALGRRRGVRIHPDPSPLAVGRRTGGQAEARPLL